MKRAAVFLLFLAMHCPHESAREKRIHELQEAGVILNWLNWDRLDHVPCLAEEGGGNSIYFEGGYYNRYASDWNAYNTGIILGDSTMDLAVNAYTGYITAAGVGAYPVSGNRSADMDAQLKNVHAQNPAFAWISTADGNGLLAKEPDQTVISCTTNFLQRVRARWPAAKICVILVHPTQDAYANAHKAATNSGIASYVGGMGNAAAYNPLPLFGVAEGQAAPGSMLADSIHPNQAATISIRNAGQAACGISF